jgi:KRAB domain-containing zinc finger protein
MIEIVPDILKKPETTAYWEEELNQIVIGKRTLEQFMDKVNDEANRMIKDVKEGKCKLKKPVSGNSSGKMYTCDKCGSVVKRVRSKKTKKHLWVCNKEDCKTWYEDNVGRRGNEIIRVEQPKGDHKCPTCGKLLASKKCLDKHIAFSHENTTGSLCPECGENFRSKAQLQDHIFVVHEGKKYGCQFCAATFNQKSGVYNHIKKIHEGKKDPPGKCPQCDKYFANSSKVKRHIREVHERKRPFVCHLCDMTFGQSGNLKTHLRGKHRNVL